MSTHSQKGALGLLLIVALAAIGIGLGAYYYGKSQITPIELPDNLSGVPGGIPTPPGGGTDSGESAPLVSRVKIALLVDPGDEEFKSTSKSRGCDAVVLVERTVPQTTQPLNAAYRELFRRQEQWPYGPGQAGNFISSRTQLNFERASIEGGVARVYLTGAIGSLGGVCDEPRLQAQIEETAFQFPNIKSVEIFLNTKKL